MAGRRRSKGRLDAGHAPAPRRSRCSARSASSARKRKEYWRDARPTKACRTRHSCRTLQAAEKIRPNVDWKMADGKTTGSCHPPFAICHSGRVFQPPCESPGNVITHQLPGGASRRAALLIVHLRPVSSLFAPCPPGAALRDFGKPSRFQGTSSAESPPRGYWQDADEGIPTDRSVVCWSRPEPSPATPAPPLAAGPWCRHTTWSLSRPRPP